MKTILKRTVRPMATVGGRTVTVDAYGSLSLAQIHEIDTHVLKGTADGGTLLNALGTYQGCWNLDA